MENNNRRRNRGGRQRLTAEQRRQFAKERQAVVGKLITQEGFQGALVIEHVRGSQYVLRLPNGQEIFASHKKQKLSFGSQYNQVKKHLGKLEKIQEQSKDRLLIFINMKPSI